LKYERKDGKIRLDLTDDEYSEMLVFLGAHMAGAKVMGEGLLFYAALEFCNDLNRENPHYQQYEIPPRYRGARAKVMEGAKAALAAKRADEKARSN
jgi:hypothetical protein